eukprot:Skav225206  [mRNA]  locus=scaffold1041:95906:98381:- [translate_table: standard]
MTSREAKRKPDSEAASTASGSKKQCQAPQSKSIEISTAETSKDLAQRVAQVAELHAGICQDYVSSRWDRLLPWAEALCAHGEAVEDELWYWETYLQNPGESAKDQFSRQLREDFRTMREDLHEGAPACPSDGDEVDSLCELLNELLELMPKAGGAGHGGADQQRFFALQLDVNQRGCTKFHDGRGLTTMRIQVPLCGPGPVFAAPQDVDWDFWDAEGGLLLDVSPQGAKKSELEEQPEEVDHSLMIQNWNQKLCRSETATQPDHAEGRRTETPTAAAISLPFSGASLDQLIEMHMDSALEEEEEETSRLPFPFGEER